MTLLPSPHPGLPEPSGGAIRALRLENTDRDTLRTCVLFLAGVAATILLFLSLPLMQVITTPREPTVPIMDPHARPVPEPFVPPPVPETKPPEQLDKPELPDEIVRPPIDLIPVTLNPTGPLIYVPTMENLIGDPLEEIFDAARLQRPPSVLQVVEPVYPRDQLRGGVSGSVLLEFVVTPQGTVKAVKVVSSTHRDFEKPAVDAIQRWRFEPGVKDNTAVFTRMRLPLHFKAPR